METILANISQINNGGTFGGHSCLENNFNSEVQSFPLAGPQRGTAQKTNCSFSEEKGEAVGHRLGEENTGHEAL